MSKKPAAAPRGITQSEARYHTADSTCLEAVTEVPAGLGRIKINATTGEVETPMTKVGTGWFLCKVTEVGVAEEPYWVHDHGDRFVSHFPNAADSRAAGCLR